MDDAPGVRLLWPRITERDPALRRLMLRTRRRRFALDLSRKLTGYLEVRWSLAARDLRDAIDTYRAGR